MFHARFLAATRRRALLCILILSAAIRSAAAQTCDSSPIAADDTVDHLARPLIVDVLANDFEPDGEALTVVIQSDDCVGIVSEDFGLLKLMSPQATAEDCDITYQVSDESGKTDTGVIAVRAFGLFFRDGFETGDTSSWELGVE